MIIRAYLEWSRTAGAPERAEATGLLADAYLNSEMSVEDRRDAEAALMMAVEDPSPLVRKAIALVIAGSERAPRPLISALSRDQDEVAAIILANSPALTETELADIAVFGSALLRRAICERPYVSPGLAAALAAVCEVDPALALLANDGAEVPVEAIRDLTLRLGDEPRLREALLARDDLPVDVQLLLTQAAARQLAAFATSCGWLSEQRAERLGREALEQTAIHLAAAAGPDDMARLAASLRTSGRLTPQLLLRAVLSGEMRMFAAALADLAEVEPARAAGFLSSRSLIGFGALYRKAGLPKALEPAFAAAVAAWQELSRGMQVAEGRLSRIMIEMVLSAVALLEGPEAERLRAVLMLFQAEAAREDARARVADILATEAPEAGQANLPPPDEIGLQLEEALALELRKAA